MIGHFFNQVFPSSIGGDVVRGYLAGRQTQNMGTVATSIALERLVGFMVLLGLIAIGQPVLFARFNDASTSKVAMVMLFVGSCLLTAPFLLERVAGRYVQGRLKVALHKFFGDARRLTASPRLAVMATIVAVAMQCSNLLLTVVIANHLGASVSFLDMLLVMPTILLVASLPISVGGWGVREAGLAVGFSVIGQPASMGVVTSVVIGLANLFSALPGAFAWGLEPPVNRHPACP